VNREQQATQAEEPRAVVPDEGERHGPAWAGTPLGRQVSALVDTLNATGKTFNLPPDDATDADLKGWLASKRGLLQQTRQ
jgi:hypothetical protein